MEPRAKHKPNFTKEVRVRPTNSKQDGNNNNQQTVTITNNNSVSILIVLSLVIVLAEPCKSQGRRWLELQQTRKNNITQRTTQTKQTNKQTTKKQAQMKKHANKENRQTTTNELLSRRSDHIQELPGEQEAWRPAVPVFAK